MIFRKGRVLIEGKTKIVYECRNDETVVIIESKDDITKHDDPSLTEVMDLKAKYSTSTTSKIFELLGKNNIPVAYIEQISEREFVAKRCQMIPLEVVVRRYADGSYLKRCPKFKMSGDKLHRFEELVFELFLKTTNGEIIGQEGKGHLTEINSENGRYIDDPLISFEENGLWSLRHPKLPSSNKKSHFKTYLQPEQILPGDIGVDEIKEIALSTFLVIEKAFEKHDYHLIDFKIEFGVDIKTGKLLISDVIDNDSWRLKDPKWKELSKEMFRKGQKMEEVENGYKTVYKLTKKM